MTPAIAKSEEEERTIAVLIAEPFNDSFEPLIRHDPLALLPMVNSPLLDYSLDWLQRCQIHEAIVYCSSYPHSEKIRDHCRHWALKVGNEMKVTVMSAENVSSLGDAMRDIYTKSILKSNFILINGLVVSNLDLMKMLAKHKNTHKKDPNCVMSCVYIQNQRPDKDLDSSRVADLIINAKTGKILSHSRTGKSSKVVMSAEILQSASRLQVLPRLEDPNVAVCSSAIPALFSDNFDYCTRDHLLQGMIEQEELLGCTVYAQLLDACYGALVSSFKAYQEISDAVMRRLAYPSVPERSLSSQRIRYQFHPFPGTYWDASAKFHKNSLLDRVVIDAGTEVDPRSRIRNAVIGKHCVIRENVTVNDSFMQGNVTVSKGSILDTCFLGTDCRLLPGVHLEPGVVVGPNTVLGPNLKVNRSVRLVDQPVTESHDDEKRLDLNPLICGKEGRAFLYPINENGVDPQWGAEPRVVDDEDTNTSDDESFDSANEGRKEGAEPDEGVSSDEEREQEFEREVKDSLLNAYKQKCALDNVILEINSSRHAYNISMENVLTTVTMLIIRVVEESQETKLSGEKLWQSVQEGLKAFGDLIKNYIKKVKDQMVVLKALEDIVNEDERFLPVLKHILYEMSQDLEILDDDVIVFWYSKGGHKTKSFPQISKSISKFIEWLKEEKETDSEEDFD